MRKIKTIIFNRKVYLIDVDDLKKDETIESVLQKLINDGVGFEISEYFDIKCKVLELGKELNNNLKSFFNF